MRQSSFRWGACRFVPGRNRCKQALLLVTVAVAGCGGSNHVQQKVVQGTGYTFSAPRPWEVVRTARQVQAVEGAKSFALVAVSRFPLRKTFTPQLWDKVLKELDRVVDGIAHQQHGSVTDSKDATIGGERGRRYEIAYDLRGKKLVERLGFVLRGKTEYFLLCRFQQGKSSAACETLFSSFELK